MDENSSGVLTGFREAYRRETLSRLDMDRAVGGWAQSLHNGFEIWWLAGMPIVLVFLLTLLSVSVVSGLEHKLKWEIEVPVPAFVWKLAARVCGIVPSSISSSTSSKKAVKAVNASSGGDAATRGSMENLTIPRHIAVIMDGNRRYGKSKYGAGVRGHSDGSKTLVAFTEWCIEAGIHALTVFAFSTENWNREQSEVDALMGLFNQFMHQIVPEAIKRDIQVRVLVSDGRKFPAYIVEAIEEIEAKTKDCSTFNLNICVSYGARDEIVGACKKIASEVARGETSIDDIDERLVSERMLTAGLPDPDILLRTSGEIRLSNFLLFQIAYSELIFVDKLWPEMTQSDLRDVIVEFNRRKRRFGK